MEESGKVVDVIIKQTLICPGENSEKLGLWLTTCCDSQDVHALETLPSPRKGWWKTAMKTEI